MHLNTNLSITKKSYFEVPIPKPEQVFIEDIVHRLSQTCRFNGGTRVPFYTGQHVMEVSALVNEVMMANYAAGKCTLLEVFEASLAGLAHDYPEAYYGDQISPVKRKLGNSYRALVQEVDEKVYIGLSTPTIDYLRIMQKYHDVVTWADLEMLFSDAARWDVFGTYVLGDDLVVIDTHNVVPPPYKLRFGDEEPLGFKECKTLLLNAHRALQAAIENEIRKTNDKNGGPDPTVGGESLAPASA